MEMIIYKMKYKLGKGINNLIFGEEFVKNNKNKGKLIINNKKYSLESTLSNNKTFFNKILLALNKYVYNYSYMYKNCEFLESFAISSNKNNIKIHENIENNFDKHCYIGYEIGSTFSNSNINICNSSLSSCTENSIFLNSIIIKKDDENIESDMISDWINEINYKKNNFCLLKENFYNCKSLISLPDISDWKIDCTIDMSYMFYNCISLKTIPDISKWNTDKVFDMSYMFYNCTSLASLPDISKWNTINVSDISYIFYNCKLLISLPNIAKWNINNVDNISYMFCNCKSLMSIPKISLWNTYNIIDMSFIFNNCKLLKNLPDLSKWNTNNVINMSHIFSKC